MRSPIPKPIHRLCGRPMVILVLDALAELPIDRVVVVVGHGAPEVQRTILAEAPSHLKVEFVEQLEPLGTGDAVAVALTGFPEGADLEDGDLVILPGDTPLVRPSTLGSLVRRHRELGAAGTVLSARVDDPTGYGRVVHGKDGGVARIVEELDLAPEDADVDEINTSIYCFRHSVLAPALRRLTPDNAQGEYYLTDVVAVLADAGYAVESLTVADPIEGAGVNDRAQLAAAEAELRDRINERWMRRGVTMVDPSATYVSTTVEIGVDATILPGVVLEGSTVIGERAVVGPECRLVDTTVGAGATVTRTTAEGASIGAGSVVGPYAALGPGAEVAPDVTVGPFFSANVASLPGKES